MIAAATEGLLDILKYALLALLYLFFARVLWAVWSEVRAPAGSLHGARPALSHPQAHAPSAGPGRAGRTDPTVPAPQPALIAAGAAGRTAARAAGAAGGAAPTLPAKAPGRRQHGKATRAPKGRRGNVGRLVITQPKARRGNAYAIAAEITVGRAPSSTIAVADDTFASQLHARVFRREGGVFVEDLGSTNGTYLNGKKVGRPEQLSIGDRLQIGATIFEVE